MADARHPIRVLYQALLDAWNRQDAAAFAALFTDDGSIVGFDGTPIDGRDLIHGHIAGIFADHRTASYVGIIREVRLLADEVALLRAVAGMVPPGVTDINPAANAIQSLVAVQDGSGDWHVTLFHNTPAAFHGRPEVAEALTEELRAAHRP
ncbi:MAG TPA: SgcJ/EcaC family oxidoreductase [bacterium]|nr:SgcJ/EcaC family oxidoreductase [bacterium]